MSTEPKITGIYKIVNTVNGKKYVGSTVNMKQRWYEHKHYLARNLHHSPKLQYAWNKYGEDAFEFSVIEECKPIKEVLLEREQFWIDELHAHGKTGYNIAKVAGSPMFGRKHTEESLKKMSAASKNISAETRKKRSDSQKGKTNSPETREKISKANKGRKWTEERKQSIRGENNHMHGKTHTPEAKEKCSWRGRSHTEETRKKMSDSQKGRTHTEESRARMSETQKNRPPASPETCKKISIANKGHDVSEQTKSKISSAHMGKPKSKESVAASVESHAIKRAERLAQLPVVLANIILLLQGIRVDNTTPTC